MSCIPPFPNATNTGRASDSAVGNMADFIAQQPVMRLCLTDTNQLPDMVSVPGTVMALQQTDTSTVSELGLVPYADRVKSLCHCTESVTHHKRAQSNSFLVTVMNIINSADPSLNVKVMSSLFHCYDSVMTVFTLP